MVWYLIQHVINQNTDLPLGSPNSYQGILYVEDGSLPSSAQTIVWPSSHKAEIYDRLRAAALPKHAKDHSLYLDRIHDPVIQKEFYASWCTQARRLPIPAGALLIFNSKTIHQGYNGYGTRLAYPISWEPSYYRNDEALRSKLCAVVKGIATNHWASLGIHHGASKVKVKAPSGSRNPAECVFPLRSLPSYPLKEGVALPEPKDIGSTRLADLKEMIKPEILLLL